MNNRKIKKLAKQFLDGKKGLPFSSPYFFGESEDGNAIYRQDCVCSQRLRACIMDMQDRSDSIWGNFHGYSKLFRYSE